MKKKLLLPMLTILISGVVTAISIFLPYATSNRYTVALPELATEFGSFTTALLYIICGLLALMLLFALLKKPIASLVFGVLLLATVLLNNINYSMIFNESVELAVGYYLPVVCGVIAMGGSIWMTVCNYRLKRAASEE